jgi:hemerythrin-like domain-containing protein
MIEQLDTGVKQVIDATPRVGEILERYDIGCVTCAVGTCKLRDVVGIHALTPDTEAQLMYEIEKALYPDREIPLPQPAQAGPLPPVVIKYSPPVRRLVDEHKWIKRVLAVIPALVAEIERTGSLDADLLMATVGFIRGYADRFHHMKEEDILFEYTDRDAEIIGVMLTDHDTGRGYVRGAVEGTEQGDAAAVCANLRNYRELLTEHIRKEDEILYPYIDRGLTTTQVGEMHRRFDEVESAAEDDVPDRYERFVTTLEERFTAGETAGQS